MNNRDTILTSKITIVAKTFHTKIINQGREIIVSEFTSVIDLINFRNTVEDMLLSEHIEAKMTTTYNPYAVRISWR